MRLLLVFIALPLLFIQCGPDAKPTANVSESESTIEKADTTLSRDSLYAQINASIVNAPNQPDGYLERARFNFHEGDIENAEKDLNTAISLDSVRSDLYFERGELFYAQQNFDGAMEDYKTCAALDEEAIDCHMRVGELQILLRNYQDALDYINAALRVNDQLPFAYYMKGRIYRETGDTTLSASSYQTAIEVDPDYYDAYIEIALLYAAARSDLAIEYYRTAREIKPESVEAAYNMAIYLQDTGFRDEQRYYEAFDLYDAILAIDPSNAAAAFNKGYIYLEYLQNYESAIASFTKATELYAGYFQAYYNRGLCYESMGNNQDALKDYNRALALQPTFTAAAIAKGRVLGD